MQIFFTQIFFHFISKKLLIHADVGRNRSQGSLAKSSHSLGHRLSANGRRGPRSCPLPLPPLATSANCAYAKSRRPRLRSGVAGLSHTRRPLCAIRLRPPTERKIN